MILNLATHPFENRRRFLVLAAGSAVLLGAATILLVGMLIRNYRSERGLSRQTSLLRQEMARLDGEQKRLEEILQRPEVVDVLDRSEFLNSLIQQKGVSWTRIFMDLEKLMPERVQIMSLRPVVKESKEGTPQGGAAPLRIELLLTAGSDSVAGLLEMVRRMEKSESFGQQVFQIESPPQQDNLFQLQMTVSYAQK